MNEVGLSPLNLNLTTAATDPGPRRRAILRQAVGEMVGVTFFGEMLKIARNSAIKGKFGHGGRGEDIFAAQLHLELARRMGQDMRSGLSEAIYNRLAKRV